ncbi:MerR family transcriptional regulator [Nonomuraea mangrovi]|uniref:MerR family transcriptional regulator n=1 Tax=Nonomuraea mangrovi TaxID=2316207 RepID=A0ABW4T7G4_9ACTN
MSETWTIGELARHAAGELRTSGQQVNGRVREVPSERLIRWYATIGLLDPPLTRRGRVALYGRRHLLQLVAIKRMQADGASIAEIQAALTGATDAMLAHAARLPVPPPTADPSPPAPSPPAISPQAESLHAESPHAESPHAESPHAESPHAESPHAESPHAESPHAESPHAVSPHAGPPSHLDGQAAPSPGPSLSPAAPPSPAAEPAPPAPGSIPPAPASTTPPSAPDTVWPGEGAKVRFWARAPESAPRSWPVHGVRLAEGVTLLIDGAGRTPSEADLEAVLAAAGPLLAVLEERRLHEGSAI